ncbi:MAG: CopG family ribbon-helix-helix protein, partial [Salinibacter sp.]
DQIGLRGPVALADADAGGALHGRRIMAERTTITIYVPQKHQDADVLGRLKKLAKAKARSVNYLAVQAILEYLEREEQDHRK